MKSLISRTVFYIYRSMPPEIRYRLKALAKVNGHSAGAFDGIKAMRDADGKKRIDRAMARVTAMLDGCNISSLEGLRCLEVGCGFVPADALCFYLLGAKSVLITDYNRIIRFDAIARAVATVDEEPLFLSASRFTGRSVFHQRWERLRHACLAGEGALSALGIFYHAPIDLSVESPGSDFDFIYSVCVLEHIPPPQLTPILDVLAQALSVKGGMLHDINLQDHLDEDGDPFGFLRRDSQYDPRFETDARGNRVRFGQWEALFGALKGVETKMVRRVVRPDARPPATALLPEFSVLTQDDCFTSRIWTFTSRIQP